MQTTVVTSPLSPPHAGVGEGLTEGENCHHTKRCNENTSILALYFTVAEKDTRVLLLSCDFSRILRSRNARFYVSHFANRKSHFTNRISQIAFHKSHFAFRKSHFTNRISLFANRISQIAFRISHFANRISFRISHFANRNSHFAFGKSHFAFRLCKAGKVCII